MASGTFNERDGGYLCIFETRDGEAICIHQHAPNRAVLLRHISQMMMREPYQLKLTPPVLFRDDLKLVSVVPADFIPIPEELTKFQKEQGDA